MTRFATRMVERARGSAPVVRPVLPSRFELGPSARAGAEESLLETEEAPPVRRQDERPLPAVAAPAPAATAMPGPAAQPAAAVAPVSRKIVKEYSRLVNDEIHTFEPAAAPAHQGAPLLVEVSVARAPPPPPIERPLPREAADQAAPSLARAAPPPQSMLAPLAPAARTEQPEVQSLFSLEEPPPPVPAPPYAPELPRRFEQPEARSAALPPSPLRPLQAREREPEAPVIHVSIGRIDVRAVPPAAPPQPKARPSLQPRLSLEEHLRLREGER